MKSTRKHELQTNELADALGRMIAKVRPHAQTVALVAAAVCVVVFVLFVRPAIQGSGTDRALASLNLARTARDSQALRDFLVEYGDSSHAPVARLVLADRLLADAVRGAGSAGGADPATLAAGLLTEAKDLYAQAAKSSETLAPLAAVGLALATVQEGKLREGRTALQEAVNKWPTSLAAAKAKAHLEMLAGYEPVVFSNEPLEEVPPPPAEDDAGKTPAPEPADPSPGADPTPPTPPPAAPGTTDPPEANAPEPAPQPKG